MKIPLSTRLLACAEYVKHGDCVADVGCDHGYLGIYLLRNKIAKQVIAADINPMPLESAKSNAAKFEVSDSISFHLSNGVQSIPRTFDVLICAGMGADTMISILESAPWLRSKEYRMILQCQSKTPMLRAYLSENGWHIQKESAIRDGRFIYTVMSIVWNPNAPRLSNSQCYYSPALLLDNSQTAIDYYNWVVEGIRIQAQHQNDPDKQKLLSDLETVFSNKQQTEANL